MKKTAVITGATRGLGWALAHHLGRAGYRLVLPWRSSDRAEALRDSLKFHAPGVELDFIACDLADLKSVARCGESLAERHPVIDLVIANAATVSPRRSLTPQGVELTFAVNHLAHFVLLQWLAANLYTHSRVIVVASSGARRGNPAFLDDPAYEHRRYRMFAAYANSKLANIGFAATLGERLAARQIACLSVHPGMLDTGIWPRFKGVRGLFMAIYRRALLEPVAAGAEVVCHFALAPEHNESRGYFNRYRAEPLPAGIDAGFGERLWQRSLALADGFLPENPL